MATTEMTPLPRRVLRRGVGSQPLSVQLTTAILLGMLLISLLPALLDPGRMSRALGQALHPPSTTREAASRLADHASLAWRTAARPAVRRVHLQLLVLQLGLCAAGALAARLARSAGTTDDREQPALAVGMPPDDRANPLRAVRLAPLEPEP